MSSGSKGSRCVGLTTFPLSCADFIYKFWESQPPGAVGPVQSCIGIALALLTSFSDILSLIVSTFYYCYVLTKK